MATFFIVEYFSFRRSPKDDGVVRRHLAALSCDDGRFLFAGAFVSDKGNVIGITSVENDAAVEDAVFHGDVFMVVGIGLRGRGLRTGANIGVLADEATVLDGKVGTGRRLKPVRCVAGQPEWEFGNAVFD